MSKGLMQDRPVAPQTQQKVLDDTSSTTSTTQIWSYRYPHISVHCNNFDCYIPDVPRNCAAYSSSASVTAYLKQTSVPIVCIMSIHSRIFVVVDIPYSLVRFSLEELCKSRNTTDTNLAEQDWKRRRILLTFIIIGHLSNLAYSAFTRHARSVRRNTAKSTHPHVSLCITQHNTRPVKYEMFADTYGRPSPSILMKSFTCWLLLGDCLQLYA